jgi:hypothetical protein
MGVKELQVSYDVVVMIGYICFADTVDLLPLIGGLRDEGPSALKSARPSARGW